MKELSITKTAGAFSLGCRVEMSRGRSPAGTSLAAETSARRFLCFQWFAPRFLESIRATPDIVWAILTDAKDFPRWNSTVTAIEGEIREGGKLRVHVPGTDRTFAPRVTDLVPSERMTWTGGFAPLFKGVRTFTLQRNNGSTVFAMEERFYGLMLPLVKKSLPDFGPIFERYASDLKREAEGRAA